MTIHIHQDDLPAACRQVEQRGLVGHRAREPKAVKERLTLVPVLPAADSAEGRATDRVVDPEEGTEPGPPVVDGRDLLEALAGHGI